MAAAEEATQTWTIKMTSEVLKEALCSVDPAHHSLSCESAPNWREVHRSLVKKRIMPILESMGFKNKEVFHEKFWGDACDGLFSFSFSVDGGKNWEPRTATMSRQIPHLATDMIIEYNPIYSCDWSLDPNNPEETREVPEVFKQLWTYLGKEWK